MNRLCIDASVVVKWFSALPERHAEQAERLHDVWQRGEVAFTSSPMLALEVLNVAARKWCFGTAQLEVVAKYVEDIGMVVRRPELVDVARWCGQGLTAYDASYVACAESAGVQLLTDDDEIVRLAPDIAVPLAAWRTT